LHWDCPYLHSSRIFSRDFCQIVEWIIILHYEIPWTNVRFWIEVLWFCSSLRLCDPGTKVNWCYYVIFWIGSRMKSTALPSQVLHFKICKIRVPQLWRWPWVSAWHLQRIKATSLLICFPFKPLRPCSNQPECASCHNKRSSPQVCGVPVPFSTRVYAFGVVTITNNSNYLASHAWNIKSRQSKKLIA